MARCAAISQGQLSRLENGPPPLRIDQLADWARLLGIPKQYHWFELPPGDDEDTSTVSPTDGQPASGAVPIGRIGDSQDDVTDRSSISADRDGRGTGIDTCPAQNPTEDPTPTLPNPPIDINIHTAQPARIADYLLGGNANFAVDRDTIDYVIDALPDGSDTVRAMARATHLFHARAVRYLAREVGLRQFLNLSTRLPSGTNVHDLTQEIAPDSRILYVIDDDVVMAHAHRLREGVPPGLEVCVRARLHDPNKLLRVVKGTETLDFTRPVGVLVKGALHRIPDDDTARELVARVMAEVPSGSHLLIAHLASDLLAGEMTEAIKRHDRMVQDSKMQALRLRSGDQVASFFDGLELVEPGIVPVDRWRPDETALTQSSQAMEFMYGAMGYKP